MISFRLKLIAGFILSFIVIFIVYVLFLFQITYYRILKYEEDKISIYTTNAAGSLEKYLAYMIDIQNTEDFEKINSSLEDFIQDPMDPEWQIMVTDKKGTLLYASDINPADLIDRDYSGYPSVTNALTGNWGLKEVRINNEEFYTFSDFVSGPGWIVIADVPRRIIISKASGTVYPMVLMTSALLMILLMLGILYINRLLHPLEALTSAMKEYGRYGRIRKIIPSGINEISLAISTFNRMVNDRKKLEKEILEISDNERIRIGHDIHDDLGQILTGIAFQLISLEEDLKKSRNNRLYNLKEISNLVSEAINKSRLIAKGLSPVALNEDGFIAAIEELLKNTEHVYNVKCIFGYDKGISIDDRILSLNLFHIAQESINNAIKHARPGEITLNLERNKQDKKEIIFKIRDDGTGMGMRKNEGMGLRIMRYRARMINSRITINSAKNKGTVVKCFFKKK